jgi:hypothetical protein
VERRGTTDRAVGLIPWRAWLAARDGAVDEALQMLDDVDALSTMTIRPVAHMVRASVIVETGRFEGADAFVDGSSRFAEAAGLVALPVHLDRLRAILRLREGDAGAIEALAASRAAFERLGARWEASRTDLWLSEALAEAGRTADARERLAASTVVLEAIGSLLELERVRDLGRTLS